MLGYACLEGGGAFYEEFQFWYFIPWPEEIKRNTLKGRLKHSELVPMNCLKFVVVIISYNLVLDAIEILGYYVDTAHSKSLFFRII